MPTEDFTRSASGRPAHAGDEAAIATRPDGRIVVPIDREDGPDTGITFAYIGDGIWRVTIPNGTGPHSDQLDGRTAKWLLRSFVSNEILDFATDLRGNVVWDLEWVTDPASLGNDVEIAWGFVDAGDGANGVFSGIAAQATPLMRNHRVTSGSVSNFDAPTPSGDIRGSSFTTDYSDSAGNIRVSNMSGIALNDAGDTLASTDDATVVGGFQPVWAYVGLNVYVPTAISGGDVSIDVRPRVWAHRAE